MATYDLSRQLAARQQAYRLAHQDRGQWETWMQRLLAGVQQPTAPAPSPPAVPPPAAGGAGAGHAARIAALQRVVAAVQAHSAQYASNPQAKAAIDQVISRLNAHIAQLQAAPAPGTGGPGAGGWQDWLGRIFGGAGGLPGMGGTPTVPGTGAGGTTEPGAAGDAGSATGWLGDLLRGFTTPITTPKPPVVPPVVTPPATPAAGGGGGAGGPAPGFPGGGVNPNPYQPAENPYGAGATWYSSPDGTGYWIPPTGSADQPAADAGAAAGAATGAATPAASGPSPADYGQWAAAAQTDYQYAKNLNAAAAKLPEGAKKQDMLQRASDYNKRGDSYISRVPGLTSQ